MDGDLRTNALANLLKAMEKVKLASERRERATSDLARAKMEERIWRLLSGHEPLCDFGEQRKAVKDLLFFVLTGRKHG